MPSTGRSRSVVLTHLPAPLLVALMAWGALVPGAPAAAAPSPAATVAPDRADRWDWPVEGPLGPLGPPPDVLRAFDPPGQPWLAGHRGVDLGADPGTPVRAAGAGVVVFAAFLAGRGVVSVQHADGLRTTYEPVTAAVAVGDLVELGDELGRLEAVTAHCATSCLHWGLRHGEAYLDPLTLVRRVPPILLPYGPPIPPEGSRVDDGAGAGWPFTTPAG